MKLSPSIFRAYDIRGIVGETLDAEIIYTLGRAISSEAQRRGENQVIVARDGRLSSLEFSQALIRGLMATGCDVLDIGSVPTPVLYFATHTLATRSGVMITGSHNPGNYNGLKITLAGETLAEEEIQALYHRILEERFAGGVGRLQHCSVTPAYLQRVLQSIHLAKPLKVVVDAGNGIAGSIGPELLRGLGCEVIELFCEIDGTFPNHSPDPGQKENLVALIDAVRSHQADIGIAFDGDGDRLGVISNKGEIIWPDRQLMLFAKELLEERPGTSIVYDVKCSQHLAPLIEAYGGVPLMWRTGHSLIKAKMKTEGALLAGEMSGHLFFKDRWFGFDDGLYAAARLLEIIAKKSCAVFDELPNSVNTPELKINVKEENKFDLMRRLSSQMMFEEACLNVIDGLRAEFKDGWGLIRPSNTSPALTLRFEADDESALQRIQALFRQQILAVDAELVLPF